MVKKQQKVIYNLKKKNRKNCQPKIRKFEMTFTHKYTDKEKQDQT